MVTGRWEIMAIYFSLNIGKYNTTESCNLSYLGSILSEKIEVKRKTLKIRVVSRVLFGNKCFYELVKLL